MGDLNFSFVCFSYFLSMRLLSSFWSNLRDFAFSDELVCSVPLFSAHQPGTLFELKRLCCRVPHASRR